MDKRIPAPIPTTDELKKLITKDLANTGRLASLRLPRDLTLGGTKPKKVFTPNLNPVRNKEKNKFVPMKNEKAAKRSGAFIKSTGPHEKHVKYIQSDSIFSQGMGETKRQTNTSINRSFSSKDRNKSTLLKSNKNNVRGNKVDESTLLNNLMANEDDGELHSEYEPRTLPLELNKYAFSNIYKIKAEKTDQNQKIEKYKSEIIKPDIKPVFSGYTAINEKQVKLEINYLNKEHHLSFLDTMNRYDDSNPALSVLQLPTTFLDKVWKDDSNENSSDCTIRDTPDGYLGNIIIRKSGKMEIIINNTKYELDRGNSSSSLETVVLFPGEQSIASEATLVNYGAVSEKFTLTPEWNSLFEEAKKKKKFGNLLL